MLISGGGGTFQIEETESGVPVSRCFPRTTSKIKRLEGCEPEQVRAVVREAMWGVESIQGV